MAAAAQYINIYKSAGVTISTANTNRDGTGTVGTLLTAKTAANDGTGAIVERLRCIAQGTTTAGMLRFFRYTGAAYQFLFEVPVSAVPSPSATVRAWSLDQVTSPAYVVDDSGAMVVRIQLMPGESLRCSTHNAETFHVTADYGEF